MAVRIARATRYLAWALKGMVTHPRLLIDMWRFERGLPAAISGRALPDLMAELTPRTRDLLLPSDTVRQLADAVSGLDVSSPLGICVRRSLVRYHFLRRAGIPVLIHFGARLKEDKNIGGHAWLTLDGKPYHEATQNYAGFAVMYTWPLTSS